MSMTIQSSVKDNILATPIDTSKVENAPAEMLRDLDQQIEKRADDGRTPSNDSPSFLGLRTKLLMPLLYIRLISSLLLTHSSRFKDNSKENNTQVGHIIDHIARPNENVGSTSSSSEREKRTLQLLFDEDAVDVKSEQSNYLNELQGFSIDILTRAEISVFPSEDPWALIEAAHEVNVINQQHLQQHLQLDCQRHEDATERRPWVKFSRNILWNAGIPIPDDEWTMISMARQNLTDTVQKLGIQLANETIRIARMPLPAIDSMFDSCFSPYCTTDADILKAAAELAREEITLAGICALPNASMWGMIWVRDYLKCLERLYPHMQEE
nr:hypothetical protein [Tanacetum cinerariifolium]